jgi:hypothetical protein
MFNDFNSIEVYMTLLTKEVAAQLNFPEGLNDGFVAPALAFAIGDTEVYGQVGGSGMFSNFWVGTKDEMLSFAEELAATYTKLVPELQAKDPTYFPEDEGGPSVLVCYWVDGDFALVAGITLNEGLAGWGCESGYIPPVYEVVKQFPGATPTMSDGNDNGPYDLFFHADLSHEELLSACSWINEYMIESLECDEEELPENVRPHVHEYIAKLKKLHS